MASRQQHPGLLVQLQEIRETLEETNAEVVADVQGALRKAGQVCCYGPGREGLVLKGFATRLHQLGIKVITEKRYTSALA